MKQTFESYLQDKHADNYHGTDDDMPDAFDNWLTDLQVEDYINYADDYGELMFKLGEIAGIALMRDKALDILNNK